MKTDSNLSKIKKFLEVNSPSRRIKTQSNEQVRVFNPTVLKWIEDDFSAKSINEIRQILYPQLDVTISVNGFPQAADRQTIDDNDSTNYDAIWVRDSIWIYHYLIEKKSLNEARQLIIKLWDYYCTPMQIDRLKNIIKNPKLKSDAMQLPHVRFDGKSQMMEDIKVNGVVEHWNHKQMDAHGLFLCALAQALSQQIIKLEDFSNIRKELIESFFTFFEKIEFENFEDAGAWEELDRINSSSIGLVTQAIQSWSDILKNNKILKLNLSPSHLDTLATRGLKRVKKQLAQGGESPDYPTDSIKYRGADSALLHLITPIPLKGLSEIEVRGILSKVETLQRDCGIIRYKNDSYQSGNYWIKELKEDAPTLTGEASSLESFTIRGSDCPANSEAQWFFDSMMALAHIHLYEKSGNNQLDLSKAATHIKRALGQITGSFNSNKLICADGTEVDDFQVPESINTVIIEGKKELLPSPITPLNWAKATLFMALEQYFKIIRP